jgi:hypothetical protein
MSGPTRKYTGGNVNFLIEEEYREALDEAARRARVRRSDIMRLIVKQWAEAGSPVGS